MNSAEVKLERNRNVRSLINLADRFFEEPNRASVSIACLRMYPPTPAHRGKTAVASDKGYACTPSPNLPRLIDLRYLRSAGARPPAVRPAARSRTDRPCNLATTFQRPRCPPRWCHFPPEGDYRGWLQIASASPRHAHHQRRVGDKVSPRRRTASTGYVLCTFDWGDDMTLGSPSAHQFVLHAECAEDLQYSANCRFEKRHRPCSTCAYMIVTVTSTVTARESHPGPCGLLIETGRRKGQRSNLKIGDSVPSTRLAPDTAETA